LKRTYIQFYRTKHTFSVVNRERLFYPQSVDNLWIKHCFILDKSSTAVELNVYNCVKLWG